MVKTDAKVSYYTCIKTECCRFRIVNCQIISSFSGSTLHLKTINLVLLFFLLSLHVLKLRVHK